MDCRLEIRHIPNDINPYESCGYGRNPRLPLANDPVSISCMVAPYTDDCNVVLYWSRNGIEQNPLSPLEVKVGARQRAEVRFDLGVFQRGDEIVYRLAACVGEESYRTREYRFCVVEPVEYRRLERVWVKDDTLHMVLAADAAPEMEIAFFFESGHLRLVSRSCRMERKHASPAVFEELDPGVLRFSDKAEGNFIEVRKSSLTISIGNSRGDILLLYDGSCGESWMTVFQDVRHKAYGVRMNFHTGASCCYGLGERFDRLNQMGLHPLCHVFEKFGEQRDKTYLPIPFLFMENGLGLFANSGRQVGFDLGDTRPGRIGMEMGTGEDADLDIHVFFGSPREIIKAFISLTGRVRLPPKWAFGPWMSSNGWNSQREVLEQVEKAEAHSIPASVVVVEAWSDEASFYIFNDAAYNPVEGGQSFTYADFRFPAEGRWPDPKGMAERIHESHMKLILWQIPVLKHFNPMENPQHRIDEAYALDKGYCVMNPDVTPYRITDNWFCNSLLLDFTNPEAVRWWFSKRKYLLEDLGVDGFKTDGGEFVYDDESVFHNGMTGADMRNTYPLVYLGAYHRFIGPERITFSRAGYTGFQRYPLYWAGDQYSTFAGLKSQLTAGLSSSVSGNPFWGFDIAGFAGEMPSKELYARATQFAVFCPVMQFHSEGRTGYNNDRSPWNMAAYHKDTGILDMYRRFACLRMNLIPYIYNEARMAAENGEPLMRPLFIDYPEDSSAYTIDDEYLFGRSMLIAPILQEGCESRDAYLPYGTWIDFWTGKEVEGGRWIHCHCGFEKIPVFLRQGSIIPLNLDERFRVTGFTGNRLDRYERLCFLIVGDIGEVYEFIDDLGTIIKFVPGSHVPLFPGNAAGLESVHVLHFAAGQEQTFIVNTIPIG